VLGTINKQGRVTILFKLKPAVKTARLYKQVVKTKLRSIRVQLTFTTPAGQRVTETKRVKLKR